MFDNGITRYLHRGSWITTSMTSGGSLFSENRDDKHLIHGSWISLLLYASERRMDLLLLYMNGHAIYDYVQWIPSFQLFFWVQKGVFLSFKGCVPISQDLRSWCSHVCNVSMHVNEFKLEACGRTQQVFRQSHRFQQEMNLECKYSIWLIENKYSIWLTGKRHKNNTNWKTIL